MAVIRDTRRTGLGQPGRVLRQKVNSPAIGLRDAIRTAGGLPVADAWIHPADLVAAGLSDAG